YHRSPPLSVPSRRGARRGAAQAGVGPAPARAGSTGARRRHCTLRPRSELRSGAGGGAEEPSAHVTVLSALHVYPVKAWAGPPRHTATLAPRGVAGARRWMVVDPDGMFLSQREDPALARIRTRVEAERLVLEAPGLAPLELSPPSPGDPVQVTVQHDQVPALDAGDVAAAWLGRHLGRPVRLVRVDGAFARRPHPGWASSGRVSFGP